MYVIKLTNEEMIQDQPLQKKQKRLLKLLKTTTGGIVMEFYKSFGTTLKIYLIIPQKQGVKQRTGILSLIPNKNDERQF